MHPVEKMLVVYCVYCRNRVGWVKIRHDLQTVHNSKKVQVGNDQEKVPTPKTEAGKTKLTMGTITMKTYHKPNEQLFSQ